MPSELKDWIDVARVVQDSQSGKCLADPVEDFVVHLLRNVPVVNPMLAARFHSRLPERVVACGSHSHD
jgi:hypothetical protein